MTWHGWHSAATNAHFNYHTADLHHAFPAPVLPAGFDLRAITSVAEIEERVAVHRSAFHPSCMTVEKHRRTMASPTYRQDRALPERVP